jgi:hypothetical protein
LAWAGYYVDAGVKMPNLVKSDIENDILDALLATEEHPILHILDRVENGSLGALYELLELQTRRSGRPFVVLPNRPEIQH